MADNDDLVPDIEVGSNDPADALPALEQKYRDQMRQIVSQRLDLPVSALLTMLKEQIKLNPEFQRRDRWDDARQSRLIESLIMNVPVPPVFLGEDEYGHYVVLDGRQRLTAVANFLRNELKLKGLDVWSDLNGLTYSDLVKRQYEKYITRRFIQAIVLLKESSPIIKYDVFERLNTGGVRANEMEIRNAVYRGGFTDLLHELSRVPAFIRLWDIPADPIEADQNKLYQSMLDLELVLRFFALSQYPDMKVNFRDYLSDFMQLRNSEYKNNQALLPTDRARFISAAESCWRVFGNQAFYRPSGKRSAPLADAVMIALEGRDAAAITDGQAKAIRDAIAQLVNSNADFQKAIGTGTNGRGAIEARITLARAAVTQILG